MQILMVTPWYPNDKHPLSGDFVRYQAAEILQQGPKIQVAVIHADTSFHLNYLAYSKNHKQYYQNLPEYIRKAWTPPKLNLLMVQFWWKEFEKIYLYYLKEKGQPDLIHAHTFLGAYIAFKIKEKYKVPYLVTEHSSAIFENRLQQLHKKLATIGYKNAALILAVSGAFKRKIQQNFNIKHIKICPNFINMERQFVPGLLPKSEIFTFIFAGNLIKRKGVDILIQSFYQLQKSSSKKAQLLILGKGREKQRLEALVEALKLRKKVHFKGELSNAAVSSYLTKAHILVLPSWSEPFGIILIEALASGIPVIGTYGNGAEDIIQSTVGSLFKAGDVKGLSELMLQMMENYTDYSLEKIRSYALENYSAKVISRRLVNEYQSIITNHQGLYS